MWRFVKKRNNESEDERRVRTINVWHFVLIVFIVIWMAGAYLYLNKKTELSLVTPPVLLVNGSNSNLDLTNFFGLAATNNPLIPSIKPLTNSTASPMFETKPRYDAGDVVVVKYFYVQAVIVEKVGQDSYAILYKDHNHVLQKIVLPKAFLLSLSAGTLNPFSLLID